MSWIGDIEWNRAELDTASPRSNKNSGTYPLDCIVTNRKKKPVRESSLVFDAIV